MQWPGGRESRGHGSRLGVIGLTSENSRGHAGSVCCHSGSDGEGGGRMLGNRLNRRKPAGKLRLGLSGLHPARQLLAKDQRSA